MSSVIKVLFFFIAGVYLVSFMNDGGFDFTSNTSRDEAGLSERGAYSRSYDDNNDGIVSDAEYKRGELRRIEDEVEMIKTAVDEALEEPNRSPYYELVRLSSGNATAEVRNEEYLVLDVDDDTDSLVDVTGWTLKSLVSGRGGKIGKGVATLDEDRPWYGEKDILLAAGDEAIITTGGAAGIRTSFLTNKCMGYFDYDRFTPEISSVCPLIQDEDLERFDLAYNDFDHERDYDACMDAIEDVGSCEVVRSPDSDLEDACRDFIRDYSNYDGCVELHKDDADFYGDEWRIFLNSTRNDLWRKEREAIGLFDRDGKVVDVVRY